MTRLVARARAFLASPAGHRLEVAVIAYAVAELQRKGWLPMFPLPKT